MTDDLEVKDKSPEATAEAKPEEKAPDGTPEAKLPDAVEAQPAASTEAASPAEPAAAAPAEAAPEVKPSAPAKTGGAEAGARSSETAVAADAEFRVRVAFSERPGEVSGRDAAGSTRMKPRRLLAEYDTTAKIIHAAETLRDSGYKSFEAHTPFPIHGMDRAMGLPDSRLGWIVLACGLTGVSCAWLMMYWMNAVDYPLIIGGKPPGSLPSMIPIMFELTVLFSSFGAVLGMFGLNRLPKHHDPVFYSDRFAGFSDDKFFISVEAEDPKFDVVKTCALLEKTRPQTIEVIETVEEDES